MKRLDFPTVQRWCVELTCAIRGWDTRTVRTSDNLHHGTRRVIAVNSETGDCECWTFEPTTPTAKPIDSLLISTRAAADLSERVSVAADALLAIRAEGEGLL